jgi:hypothetical protein
MARWLIVHANGGRAADGTRVVSEHSLIELHTTSAPSGYALGCDTDGPANAPIRLCTAAACSPTAPTRPSSRTPATAWPYCSTVQWAPYRQHKKPIGVPVAACGSGAQHRFAGIAGLGTSSEC